MAKKPKEQGSETTALRDKVIDETWARLKAKHMIDPDLKRFRDRVSRERHQSHLKMLADIARSANVDLDPIFEEARRRNQVKRTYAQRTIEKISAKAEKQGDAERARANGFAKEYIKRNLKHYRAREGNPELKFLPSGRGRYDAEAAPGCIMGSGPPWSEPDFGRWEAAADNVYSERSAIDATVDMFSWIYTNHGDCEVSGSATTDHYVPLRMITVPLTGRFRVERFFISLHGTGQGHAVMGDGHPDPRRTDLHQRISLTVGFHQMMRATDGSWYPGDFHTVGGLDDYTLHEQWGEYFNTVPIDLRSEEFASPFYLAGPDEGGGDVIGHVFLHMEAITRGSDGVTYLDFQNMSSGEPRNLQLGCAMLIGEYD
jgi:hypothetical protein